MHKFLITAIILFSFFPLTGTAQSYGMKMGDVIILSNSQLKKTANPGDFQKWFMDMSASWNKSKQVAGLHLFRADRGDRKGEILLVCRATKLSDRNVIAPGSPFTDKSLEIPGVQLSKSSDFLTDPGSYTEYHLVGAEKFSSLPEAGILGIHYIQVKPERAAEFEKFVVEKLHPRVGQLLPDLQLLYYKAVAGENKGSYITIFTLLSPEARHKYWPEGAPETELLKQAFSPLKGLALELEPFLVEGTYLTPDSGGAAAFYESRKWTDFVLGGLSK
jgi:hypothetical protein